MTEPHRCDEHCICPNHGTPMWAGGADNLHACQDPTCRYASGVDLDALWVQEAAIERASKRIAEIAASRERDEPGRFQSGTPGGLYDMEGKQLPDDGYPFAASDGRPVTVTFTPVHPPRRLGDLAGDLAEGLAQAAAGDTVPAETIAADLEARRDAGER